MVADAPQHGLLEIRIHGRGGQGGVTFAKLLASIYAHMGNSVQSFGDYAGERAGAPVRAYLRVATASITNRNKVYEPNHLVVLDESLLGDDTVSGLHAGGTLLLNSPKAPDTLAPELRFFRCATVDATTIARRHGIGTRSVVIVNTTMAGAFARALDLPLEALEASYRRLGLLSNLDAAREAYDAVRVFSAEPLEPLKKGSASLQTPHVISFIEHLEGSPTGLRTGNWRTQRPQYVTALAPCSAFCPAGNDVVGFIQALAREGTDAAGEVLARTTPLAGVCGRVCPAPCMAGCNRREYDGSVNIRDLERYVADHASLPEPERATIGSPLSVAVIGAGPAGLAATYVLGRAGHKVTLFDSEREAGGVLRTGIPRYRLPRDVVDGEVNRILRLAFASHFGRRLDSDAVRDLEKKFDAVLLATGLSELRALDGERSTALKGIEQGIDFLHRLNLGGEVRAAGHVVVLGGGNTAMDCARSALRAGAERVTVAYRRTRTEMPAIPEEIDEAIAEGIELLFLRQPVAFHGTHHVQAVELAEVELGHPDETGRRKPMVTNRRTKIECQTVLLALGQSANRRLLPGDVELRDGRAWRRDRPMRVFAAGDFATGYGTVTHAIGDGRRAAGLLMRALGLDAEVFERPDRSTAVPLTDIRLDHFAPAAPATGQMHEVRSRIMNFDEVRAGLPDPLEAHRCFSCGSCTRCDTCLVYCPEGIVRRTDGSYEIDYSYCKGCGICVTECPRHGMELRV